MKLNYWADKKTLFLRLAVLHILHGELEQGGAAPNGRTALYSIPINLSEMERQ